MTDLAGQVGAMPCDGGEGSGAGEHGDRAQSEDRAEPVTAALPTARIGQCVEDVGKVQQAVGVMRDGARLVVDVAGHSGNQRGWHPEAVRCDEASDTSIITDRFLQLIIGCPPKRIKPVARMVDLDDTNLRETFWIFAVNRSPWFGNSLENPAMARQEYTA
ncbi:hypothetical protein AB0K02_32460 [Streptomyces sp. NPDC049597]|uniref:hypothetical protein n=1 Tax=Streptomyces sp. NPDC049597 TaxID=3155276 RepID=UPI00341CABA6